MRNEDQPPAQTSGDVAEVPCDERVYFESFYKANVRGRPEDRMTIGIVAEPEARFHYNALENSLLRAFARVQPVARGATVEAWRMFQQRAELRHLDIGSGTGHWVDFFRDVYLVASSTAVEVVPHMADHLRAKYSGQRVEVVEANVAEPEFAALDLGGDFDLISAIGVMFHIVDDARWAQAVHHLAARLKPGGVWAVGGDFGAETRNVQFHKTDHFSTWREHSRAAGEPGVVRVNKRVRALSRWLEVTAQAGLEVVDLVRSDSDAAFSTPENDVLLLRRPAASAAHV